MLKCEIGDGVGDGGGLKKRLKWHFASDVLFEWFLSKIIWLIAEASIIFMTF